MDEEALAVELLRQGLEGICKATAVAELDAGTDGTGSVGCKADQSVPFGKLIRLSVKGGMLK